MNSGPIFSSESSIFIDPNNLIVSSSDYSGSSYYEYTAIKDCFISIYANLKSKTLLYIYINNVNVYLDYVESVSTDSCWFYLKAGQTIKVQTGGSAFNSSFYKVYGLLPQVPQHHYSTTEQVVGTWIDGKPLYEKTYVVDNVSSSNVLVDNTLTPLTINLVGYINNGVVMPSPPYQSGTTFVTPTASGTIPRVLLDNEGIKCNLEGDANLVVTYRFTIQYTKITDTAPSV